MARTFRAVPCVRQPESASAAVADSDAALRGASQMWIRCEHEDGWVFALDELLPVIAQGGFSPLNRPLTCLRDGRGCKATGLTNVDWVYTRATDASGQRVAAPTPRACARR